MQTWDLTFRYTKASGRFCVPERQTQHSAAARAAGRATVPTTLALELDTNPFLRCHIPAVQASVGLADGDPLAVFAEVRKRRDSFS